MGDEHFPVVGSGCGRVIIDFVVFGEAASPKWLGFRGLILTGGLGCCSQPGFEKPEMSQEPELSLERDALLDDEEEHDACSSPSSLSSASSTSVSSASENWCSSTRSVSRRRLSLSPTAQESHCISLHLV